MHAHRLCSVCVCVPSERHAAACLSYILFRLSINGDDIITYNIPIRRFPPTPPSPDWCEMVVAFFFVLCVTAVFVFFCTEDNANAPMKHNWVHNSIGNISLECAANFGEVGCGFCVCVKYKKYSRRDFLEAVCRLLGSQRKAMLSVMARRGACTHKNVRSILHIKSPFMYALTIFHSTCCVCVISAGVFVYIIDVWDVSVMWIVKLIFRAIAQVLPSF